jgi:hypothetical protein
MRFLPALFILITIIAQGCLNNSVEITGKLNNPVEGEYLFLDELKSDELITVDSVVISEDGTFKLKLETKEPAFYLLKISESNFLTMLLEPGENLKIEAHHDSLNYPVSISGSEGSELMAGYNKKLRETIDKLSGLNAIYMQNQESADLPKVIEAAKRCTYKPLSV